MWLQGFDGEWHHVNGSNFETLWDSESGESFDDWLNGSQDYASHAFGGNGGGGDGDEPGFFRKAWNWITGKNKKRTAEVYVVEEEVTTLVIENQDAMLQAINNFHLSVGGFPLNSGKVFEGKEGCLARLWAELEPRTFTEGRITWRVNADGYIDGVMPIGGIGALGVVSGPNILKTGSYLFQFGKVENQVYHAFRHTDKLGLARPEVMQAIGNHFPTISSSMQAGKSINGIISVSGKQIQYTAFQLPNGTINVGRIHGL